MKTLGLLVLLAGCGGSPKDVGDATPPSAIADAGTAVAVPDALTSDVAPRAPDVVALPPDAGDGPGPDSAASTDSMATRDVESPAADASPVSLDSSRPMPRTMPVLMRIAPSPLDFGSGKNKVMMLTITPTEPLTGLLTFDIPASAEGQFALEQPLPICRDIDQSSPCRVSIRFFGTTAGKFQGRFSAVAFAKLDNARSAPADVLLYATAP